MKKIYFILSVTLLGSLSAYAYIPPGVFVLKNLAQKKKGFKLIRIRTNLQEMGATEPEGDKYKALTFVDFEKGIIKTSVTKPSGETVANRETKMGSATQGIGSALLFDAQTDEAIQAMRRADLALGESEMSFLTRAGDRIAWGYGNKELPPQLLIEKDRFLPVKFVGKHQGEATEMTFGIFKFFREFPFPIQTDLRVGSIRLRETLEEVTVITAPKKDSEKGIATAVTEKAKPFIEKAIEVLR